ncbi:MAG: lipid-A-disaccharide synthase [Hyphomonadaceae bacterium]|nr:lipid-A-disaccharide synthase [Hyphomonadaceae bacterium]
MAAGRLYFVAAEPSGDLLARETIDALRVLQPQIEIAGIGGGELAKIGIESPIDVTPLSIVGLFDGLKVYGTVLKLADQAVDEIIANAPDAAVLVDSWGFMVRVAQRLRERAPEIKIIKLVGPQIWATRAGRAKKLAAAVDHLICIHHMEAPYYEPFGLPVTVMGNPALSRTELGNGAAYRQKLGLKESDDLLLVLPGSRPSEIRRVAPALVEAAWLMKSERPDLHVLIAPAPAVRDQFHSAFPEIEKWARLPAPDDRGNDIMAAADYALACSGTVTSELAVQGTPFLVGYKAGALTYLVAKNFLYKPEHITLLNIAADDTEIAPEFIQNDLRATNIAETAQNMLADKTALEAQIEAQNKALSRMGERDEAAPEIAAKAILEVINAR